MFRFNPIPPVQGYFLVLCTYRDSISREKAWFNLGFSLRPPLSTLCESPEICQGKIGLHFLICDANNVVANVM